VNRNGTEIASISDATAVFTVSVQTLTARKLNPSCLAASAWNHTRWLHITAVATRSAGWSVLAPVG